MGYRRAADVWSSPEAYSALLLLREAAIETRFSMKAPQIPLFLPYVLGWGSIEKIRIGTTHRTSDGSIYLEHRQVNGTGSKPADGFPKGQGCYIEHLGLFAWPLCSTTKFRHLLPPRTVQVKQDVPKYTASLAVCLLWRGDKR